MIDEYIGTLQEGKYEILEWTGEKSHGQLIYRVRCLKCAAQPNLIGDALFTATKRLIGKGNFCDCRSNQRAAEELQTLEDIQKLLEDNNFELIHHCGSFRLRVFDKLHNCCVKIVTGKNLLNPDYDWESLRCYAANRTVERLNNLVGTMFPVGTKFFKDFGNKKHSLMFCPICAEDDYSKAGTCNGLFSAQSGVLLKGARPCRCARNHQLTEVQEELRVRNLSKDTPYTYLHSHKVDGKMLYKFRCDLHGEFDKNRTSVLQGRYCRECSPGGFKTEKPALVYVLKIEHDSGQVFTGYGISNNYTTRRKEHVRYLCEKGYEIIDESLYHMSGVSAQETEYLVKQNFPLASINVTGFITETTLGNLFEHVKNFVESSPFYHEQTIA
jgi:hypothetical protein